MSTSKRIERIETHLSELFLDGERVYKFRKPVKTSFCDFTSLEARRIDCEREIKVNQRLAPDVYLGLGSMADIDPSASRDEPCVVMRQLPADRQLSELLRRDSARVAGCLDAVARQLALFHATTDRGRSELATVAAFRRLWQSTLTDLEHYVPAVEQAATLAEIDALVDCWFDGREALYEERRLGGYIADGHGDLRSDNIFCLDDGPRILDAIQFDSALRTVDIAAEVAFLVMDLRHRDRPDAADWFVESYEVASGEMLPRPLIEHAVAHWAAVRSKVACIRWDQGAPEAADAARSLIRLAVDTLVAARPRLILVGGLPGAGKTTLANALAERTGWVIESSDVVRKELAGLTRSDRAAAGNDQGLYRPEWTAATYEELLRRAGNRLARGETVILDASWTSASWRAGAAAVARETASELVELRCDLDPQVARARLAQRAANGVDASDADDRVAALLRDRFDPWPSARVLDTSAPANESARSLATWITGHEPAAVASPGADQPRRSYAMR